MYFRVLDQNVNEISNPQSNQYKEISDISINLSPWIDQKGKRDHNIMYRYMIISDFNS